MTGRPATGTTRAQGNVETLPSGALRVRVYAGIDPVTKKRHVLTEVIPPGPKAARLAELAKHRLLREVADRRSPRTSATIDQLLDRYLDQFSGAPNTLELYATRWSPMLGGTGVLLAAAHGPVDGHPVTGDHARPHRRRSRRGPGVAPARGCVAGSRPAGTAGPAG
jgi:hypothetical protein